MPGGLRKAAKNLRTADLLAGNRRSHLPHTNQDNCYTAIFGPGIYKWSRVLFDKLIATQLIKDRDNFTFIYLPSLPPFYCI